MHSHRIGAVFFVLWGILHIVGGAAMLQTLSTDGATGYLALLATALPAAALPSVPEGVATGVFAFHGYNLVWLGFVSLLIGVLLNWKNSVAGYWINLAVVSFADIGLIVFMILPGYMRPVDGAAGPVLWLLAGAFGGMGVRRGSR